MPLPEDVLAAAERLVGEPYDASPLAGLSGAEVVVLRGPRGEVVAKGPVDAAERHVTVVLAPRLAALGVRLARTRAVVGDTWLLLEHLPTPLPRARWGADPGVLAVLRRLHDADPALVEEVPDRYRPAWDDHHTDAAAEVLGLPGDRLASLQRRARPLFDPVGVASTDPNPRNWRLDGDGRPVLLDQGRLTLARPEVDLAVVLPGLPGPEEATQVVAAYGAGDPALVLLAKIWTLVELAADPATQYVVRPLVVDVPTWLATLNA